MQKRSFFLIALFLAGFTMWVRAQQPPFYDEIKAFKEQDKEHFPGQGKILFVGSSSFKYWTDVQAAFPGYPIINRGFGGSSLPDVIRYAPDIIIPYRPKQVVIYCGDNDLAASDTVTARTVYDRFVQLFHLIRRALPNEPILFVSIKPSPSRERLMPKMVEANNMIAAFIKKQPHAAFVDVYHKMLDKNGKPLPGIYREDNLHMNEKGYTIWRNAILPYLLK